MSRRWQLGALMKKNWILMKRSGCVTICEIFFPILLMFFLVGIRQAIKKIDYDVPIVDSDFLLKNSTLLISSNKINNPEWSGLTFRNPL